MDITQQTQEWVGEPTGREHPWQVLLHVIYYGLWIISLICVYFLSFGPVLRFAAKPVSLPATTSVGRAIMVSRGVSYPAWVTALYSPAFYVVGNDPRPEYRHHDLLNSYKRYLQWWTP